MVVENKKTFSLKEYFNCYTSKTIETECIKQLY